MRLVLQLVHLILTYCILMLPFQSPIIKLVQHIPSLITAPPMIVWILPKPIVSASNVDFVGA